MVVWMYHSMVGNLGRLALLHCSKIIAQRAHDIFFVRQ